MPRPLFFALPGDKLFSESLAAAVRGEIGRLAMHEFPDGETHVRLETSPDSRDVIVVATLHHPNDKVLPLLLLADTAHELGSSRVTLVAPYLAYMRQDARFHEGEAVAAKSFAALLSRTFDSLITVDPHLHRIRRLSDVYSIPATAVHATAELGEWIAKNVVAPVLIGPDEESRQWVSAVADVAHAPFVILTKTRRGDSEVSVSVPELDQFPERAPVLVDDIISTGQTMAAAVRHIRLTRHLSPICVAVHAVFADGARATLDAAGAALVVTTNTIAHPTNAIDVVPALAAHLLRRA